MKRRGFFSLIGSVVTGAAVADISTVTASGKSAEVEPVQGEPQKPMATNVQTMDAESFAAFIRKNHQAVADAVALSLQNGHGALSREIVHIAR
jgi:hypothetical protein